jgi:hypothetical protein
MADECYSYQITHADKTQKKQKRELLTEKRPPWHSAIIGNGPEMVSIWAEARASKISSARSSTGFSFNLEETTSFLSTLHLIDNK